MVEHLVPIPPPQLSQPAPPRTSGRACFSLEPIYSQWCAGKSGRQCDDCCPRLRMSMTDTAPLALLVWLAAFAAVLSSPLTTGIRVRSSALFLAAAVSPARHHDTVHRGELR